MDASFNTLIKFRFIFILVRMKKFDQKGFIDFALDNNVVGFFQQPIKLKSGRLSNWYVNWRNVAEDVFLLDRLSDYVISFTKDMDLEPDCFYGVPEGTTKLGIISQYKWAKESPDYAPYTHILPMGRGKPKDHGTAKDKYFLGQPKGKTIIIEDVTTTGGSLLKTIDNLNEADVRVIAAFGLTDRMELRDDGKSVQEAVSLRGIPYYSLSDALQLLPEACKRLKPQKNIIKAIEKEFERYGTVKLRLL